MIFLSIIILVVVLLINVSFLICFRDKLVADVPFVPIRKRALKQVISKLQLSEESVLFDLGSGDGRVLIEAKKQIPKIVGVGVENSIIPFLISIFNARGLSLDFRFDNIFKMNLTKSTHLFVYLSPEVLSKLRPKILRECAKGTRIISCDFTFADWNPVEVVPIGVENDKLSHTLYVYVI